MAAKKKLEDSPAEKKADAKEAKKAGMSAAKYEKSGADKKADDKAQKKLDGFKRGGRCS